jgi:hypothetical protein
MVASELGWKLSFQQVIGGHQRLTDLAINVLAFMHAAGSWQDLITSH